MEYSFQSKDKQEKQFSLDNQEYELFSKFIANKTQLLKFILTDKNSFNSYSYVIHRYNPKNTRSENKTKFPKWVGSLNKLLSIITIQSVQDELNSMISVLIKIYRKSNNLQKCISPSVGDSVFLKYEYTGVFSLFDFRETWRTYERLKRDENKWKRLEETKKYS